MYFLLLLQCLQGKKERYFIILQIKVKNNRTDALPHINADATQFFHFSMEYQKHCVIIKPLTLPNLLSK